MIMKKHGQQIPAECKWRSSQMGIGSDIVAIIVVIGIWLSIVGIYLGVIFGFIWAVYNYIILPSLPYVAGLFG
jgi:uncharacterized membrane protein YkgB